MDVRRSGKTWLGGSVIVAMLGSVSARAILPPPFPVEPIAAKPLAVREEEGLEDFPPPKFPGYDELFQSSRLRPMELPEFGEQPNALGYEAGKTFAVPKALRERVDFWKRIYAEVTSDQALVHHTDRPAIVYETLDLMPLKKRNLSGRAERKELKRLYDSRRDYWAERLRQLHELQKTPLAIPDELLPLFRQFEGDRDPDRFLRAAERIRVQRGQRDRIVRGFLFGGRYFPIMTKIFEAERVPKELTRLPLVESAFDLRARSKVGASGVWQFMRSTGRLFLRVDRVIDERNDPIAATYAAARLLRSNYERLGNWALAVTAYNHGPEGMDRARREVGTDDLPTIIEKYQAPTFGFASKNFFSEFLAILEVERDYRKHFGKLMVDEPIAFAELALLQDVKAPEVASACGISTGDFAKLNPALSEKVHRGSVLIPSGYVAKVPPEKLARCVGKLGERRARARGATAASSTVTQEKNDANGT
jgi:membrane-bound lytic murein transglycosylase D